MLTFLHTSYLLETDVILISSALRPTSNRTKVRTVLCTSDMRSCMKNRTQNGSYTGRLLLKQLAAAIFFKF